MKSTFDCSCIIPTHGRDSFLREAIVSVLEQSVRPAEIIIVDDIGSQATSLMVESLSTVATPLRYLDASELAKKSAGASRNFGAKAATGSYIAFLDDDDLWKPHFLKECQNLIKKNAPTLVAAWASFLSNGEEFDGQSLPTRLVPSDGFSRNPGLTGSNFVILRSAFLDLGGFDTNLWVSNDRDFLIRFLDSGHSYGVVRDRLVLQRVHREGQLTNRTDRRARGIEVFIDKYRTRMTPADRRLLNRELYSIQRVCHKSVGARILFTIKQLLTYHPSELIATVAKKSSGRSTSYS